MRSNRVTFAFVFSTAIPQPPAPDMTRTVNTKHRAASGMAEAYEECEKFSPRRRGACMEAADRETNEYTGAQYDEN